MTARLLRLELLMLVRGGMLPAGLALLLLAGAAAAWFGHAVIDRQRAALSEAGAIQEEQHRAILDVLPPETIAGDQAYYLRFLTGHQPSAWAPLSIGQRDVQAFNLKVRLLSIHGQLYDADLSNPLLTAFGNFDLAFVLVYLVPLLVIALTYNHWSVERELGTWDLVRSQPASPAGVLARKAVVRAAVVLLPVLLLVAGGAALVGAPWDWRLAVVLGLSAAYITLWVGASLLVAALGRSSDFNLVALLGVWVVWAVLGPALVTVVAATRHPVAESLEIAVRQRQGYHGSWDRPVRETMALFYERHPEWREVPVPEDRYSNPWYYGMQHRGDLEAEPAAAAWREALARRDRFTARALVLFPPALLQRALNALAATDLESHLAYLDSVIRYHEALERWYFPAIFDNRPVSAMDWASAPRHAHEATARTGTLVRAGGALAAVTLLVLAAALWQLRVAVGGRGLRDRRRRVSDRPGHPGTGVDRPFMGTGRPLDGEGSGADAGSATLGG